MITSTHNPKIQWVRGLQARHKDRQAEQACVVEGVRLAEEALAAGWEARLVLYTADLNERGRAVVSKFSSRGCPAEEVSEAVMSSASDTQSPQGLLVVLKTHSLALPERLTLAFVPDGVRDPGNLGTMLRTAAAAGVEAVLLPPGTADPFAPKVLRAAMGAQFRLPVVERDWETLAGLIKRRRLRVYIAEARAGAAYTQSDFRSPLALIIGGEAEGASPQARALAQAYVHIPMQSGSESLNAAAAAAVLMFEIARQRGG